MPETKEWTLMFYFASDNPLAISVVSQLKAIKAAGFHPDANVVAQFDPYTEGTPTHVFDVNLINKLKDHGAPNIGFPGNDPLVRNMIEDKLWRDERTRPAASAAGESEGELVRNALNRLLRDRHGIDYRPPVAPDLRNGAHLDDDEVVEELDPETSLKEFLRFCADKYPARHYMLFMLGHGVVVGNDIFMFDEHASKHSLTLTELGKILSDFKLDIELEGSEFELVSFQSCSVSSLEVAYELQGTARYMLASQGPAFVGSWPYRQILIRIFNDLVEHGRNINVRELLLKIYNFCLLNSADYLLAGYSFQVTLCDLDKIQAIKQPVARLSAALLAGLQNDLTSKDYILLSHWKSQSFFNEMYTDLYDFCFCFSNKVKELRASSGNVTQILQDIDDACNDVMDTLVKENPRRAGDPLIEQLIVGADSLGPAYQYSRGLSVFFPWSEPTKDSRIMAEYEKYKFSADFAGTTSWLSFLRAYFIETMRDVSKREPDPKRFLPLLSVNDTLDEDIASLVYAGEGVLTHDYALAGPKSDPTDKTGGEYECISIKNYPRDIRPRRARRKQADLKFPLTEAFGLIDQNGQNGNH
jgi:hypothetical protein